MNSDALRRLLQEVLGEDGDVSASFMTNFAKLTGPKSRDSQ